MVGKPTNGLGLTVRTVVLGSSAAQSAGDAAVRTQGSKKMFRPVVNRGLLNFGKERLLMIDYCKLNNEPTDVALNAATEQLSRQVGRIEQELAEGVLSTIEHRILELEAARAVIKTFLDVARKEEKRLKEFMRAAVIMKERTLERKGQ